MSDIIVYSMDPNPAGGTVSPPGVVSPDPNLDRHDPDDDTYAGTRPARSVLDATTLLERARSIHARYPITDPSTGAPYTDEALEAAVTAWISAAGA